MKYNAVSARSQLDELTFVTFNVRMAAFNGVKCIDHIDRQSLSPCDASGYDAAIGLQETKRDKTSDIVPSRCRVYFSGDCSGVKGRKGRHEVGLAITEKADKDGIVRGSLRPDRVVSDGGAEGHIHVRPRQHRSMSARSRIRLRFDLGENQEREDR